MIGNTNQEGFADRGNETIVLFDVDGTLTMPRLKASEEMIKFLSELRKHVVIGMVGGSDLKKQKEQLGDDVLDMFDYTFSENGLIAYKGNELLGEASITQYLGEIKLKEFLSFVLHYIADLDIPIKRGTFVEFRKGMLNISPIGRNCSQKERCEFEIYDQQHGIRQKFVDILKQKYGEELGLTFSIGGQISFDVFPKGWDKTYALQFVEMYNNVHFFGDKTYPGGNDYEIYESERTIGHSVKTPDDTMRICKDLFM